MVRTCPMPCVLSSPGQRYYHLSRVKMPAVLIASALIAIQTQERPLPVPATHAHAAATCQTRSPTACTASRDHVWAGRGFARGASSLPPTRPHVMPPHCLLLRQPRKARQWGRSAGQQRNPLTPCPPQVPHHIRALYCCTAAALLGACHIAVSARVSAHVRMR